MAKINWSEEEKILVADLLDDFEWRKAFRKTTEGVAELSDLLSSTTAFHPPEDRPDNFRNQNGVALKANNLIGWHPNRPAGKGTRKSTNEIPIVEAFMFNRTQMKILAAQIRDKALAGVAIRMQSPISAASELEKLDPHAAKACREGGFRAFVSYIREQDPSAHARKVAKTKSVGGVIVCEVCGFDFERIYGADGQSYIEVHHVPPLHVSEITETRMEDLVILCASCHRAAHRSGWIRPDELKVALRAAAD